MNTELIVVLKELVGVLDGISSLIGNFQLVLVLVFISSLFQARTMYMINKLSKALSKEISEETTTNTDS